MKKIVFAVVCAVGWLATSGAVSAQEPTCADLQWGDWVADRPYIQSSCAGVVERNGVLYAKFNATMERYFNNGDVKLRIHAPDGSWNVDTFRPPKDFLADVDGQPTAFAEAFGAELRSGAEGVRVDDIVVDKRPPEMRYLPGHPDANEEGYVAFPGIKPAEDMVDLLNASRGYQANVSAMAAVKDMIHRSIDLLR